MKVLQLVSAMHPDREGRASLTGPERRAASLAVRFAQYGIDPIIAYPSRGLLWQTFKESGVALLDYETSGKFDLFAPGQIARMAVRSSASLIHAQGPGSLDAAACLGGALAGMPVVITRPVMIEDITNYSAMRRRIYSRIDKLITMRRAACIVAVSEAGLRHLTEVTGASRARVRLIRNGADLSRYRVRAHGSSQGGANEKPVVLGMIGHLLPYKGWDDFLRVIARLKGAGLNLRGEIVGEGVERPRLEALARELGLQDSVAFLGYRSDIADVLQRFDMFLFTSHREGLSMAAIEAMASGLPIVATDVGGIREQVVEGRNGYVLPTGDIEGLAARAAALIRDPAGRAAMGAAARDLALDRFDEHRMLDEYVRCYRDVRAAWDGAAAGIHRES